MDAREVIRHFLQGTDLSCDDLITALEWHGNRIIHRDENHGPTRDRAAEAVGNHNKTGREWVPGSLWDSITQEAVGRIRAMEVKHG